MNRSASVAAGLARFCHDLYLRLSGRHVATREKGVDPPAQLPLAARRSTQWRNIDALLDTLRRADAGSDIAA